MKRACLLLACLAGCGTPASYPTPPGTPPPSGEPPVAIYGRPDLGWSNVYKHRVEGGWLYIVHRSNGSSCAFVPDEAKK